MLSLLSVRFIIYQKKEPNMKTFFNLIKAPTVLAIIVFCGIVAIGGLNSMDSNDVKSIYEIGFAAGGATFLVAMLENTRRIRNGQKLINLESFDIGL